MIFFQIDLVCFNAEFYVDSDFTIKYGLSRGIFNNSLVEFALQSVNNESCVCHFEASDIYYRTYIRPLGWA